ncbi:prepilin-type N-terminal cleavage/methylation domain-containing protein [Lachnospiraceae bacterium XPB1003]|nr:prepilin-type N-terminal cleavage/methylation domain-containing protein [Lachnospiraceae bacterium XPB1003]
MRKNKGFSLVELIIVIAIMAILVGVLAPQLIKYIEKSKVAADTQVVDSVHTAMLTAMMDPEVANADSASGNSFTGSGAVSAITSTSVVGSAFWEVMGGSQGAKVSIKLKSYGASTGNLSYSVIGNNKISVWISGTDSRGSKNPSASYYIRVE